MDIKFGVGGFQIFTGDIVVSVDYRVFIVAFLKTARETRERIGQYILAYMNNYQGVK